AAMQADMGGAGDAVLRVDGGMSASDYTMQFLSDIIDARVDRPKVQETTALGAAWLAGSRADLYPDMDGFAATWALERSFEPSMAGGDRDRKYAAWQRAVTATMSF
ncbi:MAG: FGGY-family carbohydrate kinase, partial [Phaeobacter gallaeciensis]